MLSLVAIIKRQIIDSPIEHDIREVRDEVAHEMHRGLCEQLHFYNNNGGSFITRLFGLCFGASAASRRRGSLRIAIRINDALSRIRRRVVFRPTLRGT